MVKDQSEIPSLRRTRKARPARVEAAMRPVQEWPVAFEPEALPPPEAVPPPEPVRQPSRAKVKSAPKKPKQARAKRRAAPPVVTEIVPVADDPFEPEPATQFEPEPATQFEPEPASEPAVDVARRVRWPAVLPMVAVAWIMLAAVLLLANITR